jgi:hypothetical protein
MANTSGTALDGTWTAVTQLPAGSWTVTYTAVVAKGPVPTVRSGTISVAGTEPTSSSPGSSPSNVASGSGGGTQSSAPNPVESAGASSREPSPSRGAQPSAPTSNTSPGAEPVSSAGAVANPSADNGGVEPLATPDGAAGPAGRGAVPSGGGGGATAGSDDPSSPDLLNMVLLLGIVGVAAVALVGVGWIAITGRRNDPEASLADAGIGADPAIRAIPTVEQRAIRRARLNQSNDPILAALGLPDNDPPPPAADELEGRRPRGKKRAER